MIAGAVLIAAALVALGSAGPAGATASTGGEPDSIVVEDWSAQPVGRAGIPLGWEGRGAGHPRYDFTVEEFQDGGRARRALHLRSERDNSTISKRVGKIDVRRYPLLEWRWRAIVLPAGGDCRRAATDDQAAQVYVVFPRFPPALRSRIIGYVWDSTAPAGGTFASASTSMVTYVVVRSGPAEVGPWVLESRNVLEDYRRIYGDDPGEAVEVVSIAIDSNDTRSRAESYFGEILFRKPPARR